MPKKSMFGFITFSFSQGAALQNTEPPPAFEILMSAPVRRFFPEPRQQLNGGWRRARVLHPSEDLSELPPLRSVVAGQEYHCPRTRSLRGSLPKLLLDGWVPLVTLLGRLYADSCTGGLRASSASLFHFWLIRLMSFQSLDMYFSSCTRWTENVPSLLIGIKSRLFTTSFEKFFNFFQNSSFALTDSLLPDMHDPRNLLLCFLILIPQRQQDFLFHG